MNKMAIFILAGTMALAPLWAAAPPPGGGTISIEPKTGDGEYDPATPSFVNAASEALAGKGFTILEDPGHAAYIAELILSRVDVGTGSAKVPASRSAFLPGGASGSVGAGITIPLSTGKSTLVPLQRTQVEVRIRKRGEPAIVWHGTAVTVRAVGSQKGGDEAIASALSEAVLRSYPAEPNDVVGVP